VPEADFDPGRLIAVLARHSVKFIVIGAVAAIAQGSPLPTEELDITPEREPENLERLAVALQEVGAKLRVPRGEGVDFPIDAEFLGRMDEWSLTTQVGDLRLAFVPAGTRGYGDLVGDAFEVDLGAPVLVASLRDVIRSKEAANRPKDIAQLPALRQTLEVIRDRERRGPSASGAE
jgi:hypothetical protein